MSKNPQSLYDICISNAAANCITVSKFRCLPNNVLFDFYCKMFLEKRLCLLAVEFSDLEVFNRMVCVTNWRTELLRIFQCVIDHETKIPEKLVQSYAIYVTVSDLSDSIIDMGLRIGGFFNEAGCYDYSIKILNITEEICKKQKPDIIRLRRLLDCYHRRIYAEAMYCEFKAAKATFISTQDTIKELEKLNSLPNLAGLYSNFSLLYFIRSEYDEAYKWSKMALKLLTEDLPPRIIIEVLRQASKSCVAKRHFNQAEVLIQQAVNLSINLFLLDHHPHFTDTLLDYAFYLVKVYCTEEGIEVYKRALNIRKEVFGENNIHVALAHNDLAYAFFESDDLSSARKNANHSIRIMQRILPRGHFMLASVKRIKGLILEQIAIDRGQSDFSLTFKAERLLMAALSLSYRAFGVKNIHTAQHCGDLGYIYYELGEYKKAETLYLRAIATEEELLSKDDYQLGISMNRLASLYLSMDRHKDAEKLYKRSIEISLNVFDASYSNLYFAYLGLAGLYLKMQDENMVYYYCDELDKVKLLQNKFQPVVHNEDLQPLGHIIDKFWNMC